MKSKQTRQCVICNNIYPKNGAKEYLCSINCSLIATDKYKTGELRYIDLLSNVEK